MFSQNLQSYNKNKTKSFTPHHFWNKSGEGFTLIELLVVISIIGLISSIVLVSMKGFGEDARLAKSKKFSSSIQHALGADAVGIWRFEAVSAGITPDESGYGNDGTVNGATLVGSEIYPGTNALSFDGVDDYINCGNKPSLNPLSGNITIEMWLRLDSDPNCDGNNNYRRVFNKASAYRLILEQGRKFTWDAYTAGGTQRYYGSGSKIPIGLWTFITLTYDSSTSESKIYFDGEEISGTYWSNGSGRINSNGNSFYINTSSIACPAGNGNFHGLIDEVRIYETALSVAEIQKHYAEGAARHGVAIK